jgi:hypothetical protein
MPTVIASFGGGFILLIDGDPWTHVTPSTGRMGSSIGPPSIHSDSYAPLDTTVICVPGNPQPATSPFSTSTVGTKFESCSVPAIQTLHGINITDNYSGCAGTWHPSLALKRPFLSTSSKHITKSLFKASSIYTTFISLFCRSRTIRDS